MAHAILNHNIPPEGRLLTHNEVQALRKRGVTPMPREIRVTRLGTDPRYGILSAELTTRSRGMPAKIRVSTRTV